MKKKYGILAVSVSILMGMFVGCNLKANTKVGDEKQPMMFWIESNKNAYDNYVRISKVKAGII